MTKRSLMKKLAVFCLWALWLPSVATANEAAVKLAMQKRYPDIPVESVARTPIAGLYEVFTGGEVLYVRIGNSNGLRLVGWTDNGPYVERKASAVGSSTANPVASRR